MTILAALVAVAPTLASAAPVAADAPRVNAAALRSAGGHLAFVWRKALYLTNARNATLRRIPLNGTVAEMRWSDDATALEYRISDAVWVVRADGSGAHAVPTSCPPQYALCNAARSLDGATYAYVKTPPYPGDASKAPWSDQLFTMPVSGGAARERYVARDAGMRLVGWQGGDRGVLYWLDPLHSGSLAADGLPLVALTFGNAPHTLTTTLPYSDWIAWSPRSDRVLTIAGGPRTVWHGKKLTMCELVRARCQAMLERKGSVVLDPAWSPKGKKIAFVLARDLGDAFGFRSARVLSDWVATRTLWIADADGAYAQRVAAAASGVYRPAWSQDGRQLLYVQGNALWSVIAMGGTPQRVIGPFPNPPSPMGDGGMYGYVFWSAVYAWTPH